MSEGPYTRPQTIGFHVIQISRIRAHNQKITAAARAIAERKTVGDLS